MSEKSEDMPTGELHEQLFEALSEIGASGSFRIMTDSVRPDISRPVMHEIVFFDEDDELTSQRVIYTASSVSKPRAAQKSIDRVSNTMQSADPKTNPVKYAIAKQEMYPDENPYFLDEIFPTIKSQQGNTARAIGGLLIVKDVSSNVVGLRCYYNRVLLDSAPTWELRELAINGVLDDGGAESIKVRNQDDLGNIAVQMVVHCLAASKKLKPALIHAPSLGLQGV